MLGSGAWACNYSTFPGLRFSFSDYWARCGHDELWMKGLSFCRIPSSPRSEATWTWVSVLCSVPGPALAEDSFSWVGPQQLNGWRPHPLGRSGCSTWKGAFAVCAELSGAQGEVEPRSAEGRPEILRRFTGRQGPSPVRGRKRLHRRRERYPRGARDRNLRPWPGVVCSDCPGQQVSKRNLFWLCL